MRFQIAKIEKEILSEKQDSHITHYKYYQLQQRLNEAFVNDKSHTVELSQ